MTIAIIVAVLVVLGLVAYLGVRFYRRAIGAAQGMTLALGAPPNVDPYREPAPEPKEHPPDCPGCEWMDRRGRWQPPEVMFEAGIPFECMKLKMQMTEEEIDELAERLGFKRQPQVVTTAELLRG